MNPKNIRFAAVTIAMSLCSSAIAYACRDSVELVLACAGIIALIAGALAAESIGRPE